MSSIVTISPGLLYDGVGDGGPPVFRARALPTDAEMALLTDPAVVTCLRASHYDGENKWYDAVGTRPFLLAPNCAVPTIKTGGVGGHTYLKFGAGGILSTASVFQAPPGSNLWPIGADYTLAVLIKSDGDNGGSIGTILGNDRVNTTADGGTINGCSRLAYASNNGQIGLTHRSNNADGSNNSTRIVNSPSGSPFTAAAGLNMVLVSFKYNAPSANPAVPSTAAMRVNNTQVATNANVAEQNRSSRLLVGGNFDGTTLVSGLRYAEVYEVLALNKALHDAAQSALLTKLNTYVSARYGIF